MSGQWEITKENPYSGHFKKGTKALMIGRASTTLSNRKQVLPKESYITKILGVKNGRISDCKKLRR